MTNLTSKLKKAYRHYCNNCNQFLSGEGSMILPYKCNCGEYEYDIKTMRLQLKKEGLV